MNATLTCTKIKVIEKGKKKGKNGNRFFCNC